MVARALADVVLVLHLAFIVFVLAGALLALRWRWAPLLHLPAAVWGVWIEVAGGLCPLTPLENHLRAAADVEGYSGGFIEHYLVPAVYPPALTEPLQLALAGAVVAINAGGYLWVWRRRRRGGSEQPAGSEGPRLRR
jgi:hypothetical protein